MGKYQNIIWDMDGTLLNTLEDLTISVNAALLAFGLPARWQSEVRGFVGNGIRKLMERAVPGGASHPQFEEIFTFFEGHYLHNSRNKTRPYEQLEEVLRELKAQGYRMAIVSNKADAIVRQLTAQYFPGLIDVSIGETAAMRQKPAPDAVFAAMRQLKAKARSTVYIGDSEVDIATAASAGLDCISVAWGFRDAADLRAAGARRIVRTPQELLRVLEESD